MKCPSCGKKPMDQTDTAFVCICGATVKLKQWADTNGRSTMGKPSFHKSQPNRERRSEQRAHREIQESRAERIHSMIGEGKSTAEISETCGVSQRWVQQLYRVIAAAGVA